MIDLHLLKVFTLVAEKKSFSAAADAMLLSQPTVSSHIKRLEGILGVALFDRMPRNVTLTKEGEILYGYSREILRLCIQAQNAVREFSGRITGTLEVGGSTIPGEYILPKLLGRFRKTAPEVAVYLHIADSKDISSLVLEGKAEMGMVGARPDEDALLHVPFCRDNLVLIIHPSHELARKKKSSAGWDILLRESLWLREPGSGSRKTLADALAKKGKKLEHCSIVGQLGSTEAVKQAVREGGGVAVVSSMALGEELASGRLHALRLTGLDLTRNFYIIRHRHRSLSPAAKSFFEFLMGERDSPGRTAKKR